MKKQKAEMENPQPQITYGYICKKRPNSSVWVKTYEEAVSMAKSDQPVNRPYFIVERIEHFEICGRID
jgi:hypothetical protein